VLHCHFCLAQSLESSLHATFPCLSIAAFSYSKALYLKADGPSAFLIVWQTAWILMVTVAGLAARHENFYSVNGTTI